MYLYESHLGGIYTTGCELSFDDLYCEECGDSDWPLGEAESAAEAWDILKPMTELNGEGGYLLSYIFPIVMSLDGIDIPTTSYGHCRIRLDRMKKVLENLERK